MVCDTLVISILPAIQKVDDVRKKRVGRDLMERRLCTGNNGIKKKTSPVFGSLILCKE
jgi:hypothetical protein